MARKKKIDVQKFGGMEDVGNVQLNGFGHDVKSVEAQSDTKLEYDEGVGAPAVIRCFTFGMNPETFRNHQPTRQELFNSHVKGIEIALWKDGLAVFPDVEPRLLIDEQAMQYKIFVGAKPSRGHLLSQTPQTLKQIAHG